MGTFSRGRIFACTMPHGYLMLALLLHGAAAPASADPWADAVRDYSPGLGAAPDYIADPTVALGAPERITGEMSPFGPFVGDVTMFNTPFGTDEIISIGAGGFIELEFNEPIVDDPSHLYGIDLIVFGNALFIDDFLEPGARVEGIASESALVEVSQNGVDWFAVPYAADGLFPTQGFLDAEAFGQDGAGLPSGTIPTDYLKPVDPSLTIDDFLGLDYAAALALYDGSGGGAPIDIAGSGLSSASFVRISLPDGVGYNAEIDAVAAVPEPSAAAIMLIGVVGLAGRRRRQTPRI